MMRSFSIASTLLFGLLVTGCGAHGVVSGPGDLTLDARRPLAFPMAARGSAAPSMPSAAPASGAAMPTVVASPALAPSDVAPTPSTSATRAPAASTFQLPADFPRFTHTVAKVQGDPVNLLVGGTRDQIVELFEAAGWAKADPITALTSARMAKADLTNGSYPSAPVSDLFLFNHAQDLAYEKNCQSVKARDHLRVWKTPLVDGQGQPFWAIAASHDASVKWLNKRPTHRISPDVDTERALVIADIQHVAPQAIHTDVPSLAPNYNGNSYYGQNGEGDPFFTDGRIHVFELGAVDLSAAP